MTSGEIITIVAIIAAMVCFIVWRLTLTREPRAVEAQAQVERPPATAEPAPPAFTLEPPPAPAAPKTPLGLPAPGIQQVQPAQNPIQTPLTPMVAGMHLAANRKRLRIVYKNNNGGVSSREIRPHWVFIAHTPGDGLKVIRVTGHCYNAGARRTFRLDRMKRVTTMGDRELTNLQAVFAPLPIPPAETFSDQPQRLYSLRPSARVTGTEAEQA